MSNLEMSLEMSVYNRAKKWAKASGLTDVARVNRALGLIKKDGALAEAVENYGSSADGCGCPDNEFSGNVCKHIIALQMKIRIEEGKNEFFSLQAR